MGEVSTIGLDIAKSIFQIHGVDVDGAVVIRKRVSRASASNPPSSASVD
jgi:transposase